MWLPVLCNSVSLRRIWLVASPCSPAFSFIPSSHAVWINVFESTVMEHGHIYGASVIPLKISGPKHKVVFIACCCLFICPELFKITSNSNNTNTHTPWRLKTIRSWYIIACVVSLAFSLNNKGWIDSSEACLSVYNYCKKKTLFCFQWQCI